MKKFKLVVCGGTFDHFHKGHEEFLRFAVYHSDKVLVGITSDNYIQKKVLNDSSEPYEVRKDSILKFLQRLDLSSQVEIKKIDSQDIPPVWATLPIEAIVATEETFQGAEFINNQRKKKSLSELPIIKAPLAFSENGKIISSLRIRNGEIDRLGKLYVRKEWLSKDLRLPDYLREKLKKPFGTLIKGKEDNLSTAAIDIRKQIENKRPVLTITVGDVVTQSFNKERIPIDVAIVDFKVRREEKFRSLLELGFKNGEPNMVVDNPSGTITSELISAIQQVTMPSVIRIIGEEDLAVLPVILSSPLGTYVFYGQPQEGIVSVLVTEEKKAQTRDSLAQFEAKET